MNYMEQSKTAGRHIFPDLARAVALIGIALVNVSLFAYPMMGGGYHAGGLTTPLDNAAFFAVNALATMKSYTLFSFMFGVGFAYQMQAAERQGAAFSDRYWRRITGLFCLGALHGAFFFQGDILAIYAILGSFLFLFRHLPADSLIKWAACLYIAQLVLIGLVTGMTAMGNTFAPEVMAAQAEETEKLIATAIETYSNGNFWQAASLRFSEWTQMLVFGNMMQGLGALSFFLFGFAAVRLDLIAAPGAPFWRRCRRLFLPLGLVGSAWGAYVIVQGETTMATEVMTGLFLIAVFSPFATAGYLGLIAKWSEAAPGPLTRALARGGTASLTAYLMQSLILSMIFCGYGLGYYAELGAAACIAIAFATALFTIAFTSLWRIYFARGPMEILLRRWTYSSTR